MSRERVFISAETSEFWQLRDDLHDALVKLGYYVSFQRTLTNEGLASTVIHQISISLGKCQKAIFLVGSSGGSMPPETETRDFQIFLPPEWKRATYTQWEFFLATMRERTPRPDLVSLRYWVWFAPFHVPDRAKNEADDLQQQFREFVRTVPQSIRIKCEQQSQLIDAIIASDAFAGNPDFRPRSNYGFTSIGSAFQGRMSLFSTLLNDWSEYCENPVGFFSTFFHGTPGIGKTTAALEFAYRYRMSFEAIFRITGKSSEQLISNFVSLANDLGDTDVGNGDKFSQCRRVADSLSRKTPWLLILDNIDSQPLASTAETLLCNLTGGFVLLTGRRECILRFTPRFVALPVLSVKEGERYLMDRTKGKRRDTDNDSKSAADLSEDLGGLPLALEQACHYVCEKKVTIAAYHALWRKSLTESERWVDADGKEFEHGVVASFLPTFKILPPDAIACLHLIACFAPSGIPESWIQNVIVQSSLDYCVELLELTIPTHPDNRCERVNNAVLCLRKYGLLSIEHSSDMLSIHRVTRAVSRCIVPASTLLEFSRVAGYLLLSVIRQAEDESFDSTIEDEGFNSRLIPHASDLEQTFKWTDTVVGGEVRLQRSEEFKSLWEYLDAYRERVIRRQFDDLARLIECCRERIVASHLKGERANAEWKTTAAEITTFRDENNIAITSFMEENDHRIINVDDQNLISEEAARRFMDDSEYRSALASARFELGKLALEQGDFKISQVDFEESLRLNDIEIESLLLILGDANDPLAPEGQVYANQEEAEAVHQFIGKCDREPAIVNCLQLLRVVCERQGNDFAANGCALLLSKIKVDSRTETQSIGRLS